MMEKNSEWEMSCCSCFQTCNPWRSGVGRMDVEPDCHKELAHRTPQVPVIPALVSRGAHMSFIKGQTRNYCGGQNPNAHGERSNAEARGELSSCCTEQAQIGAGLEENRQAATPPDSGAKELPGDGDLRSWEGAQGLKAEVLSRRGGGVGSSGGQLGH